MRLHLLLTVNILCQSSFDVRINIIHVFFFILSHTFGEMIL